MVLNVKEHALVTEDHNCIEINGAQLTIEDLVDVALYNKKVKITTDANHLQRMKKSIQIVKNVINNKELIYGITTNFGGLANVKLDDDFDQLQTNLLWGLKCGAGHPLPVPYVRAAMLCRANALCKGFSGIRIEIIERFLIFLNAGITPIVRELGSIGASGDLIPLAAIAGVILGLSFQYKSSYQGKEIDANTAAALLGLSPLKLQPKEGLALVNGTSAMTGMAALNLYEGQHLFKLTLYLHALYFQALCADMQCLEPFVHHAKPHSGQIKVAKTLHDLISHSDFVNHSKYKNHIVQDRYSIRCLPQYLGVIADNFDLIHGQIEIEMNSATDNPLIDPETGKIYHSGNFLGQYIAQGMDTLRYSIGLMAKHIDAQIALMVTPEFSGGLPPSLIGNENEQVKFGLKGLQICGNSIMPELLHLGQPLIHLFPTHAEQFNQNINSLGFTSANLSRKSLDLYKRYCVVSLIFAMQAVQLRSYQLYESYDSSPYLSPETRKLYDVFHKVIKKNDHNEPLVKRNNECDLELIMCELYDDLCSEGSLIFSSLK